MKELKMIIHEYYQVLDMIPDRTRHREQVQARAAMMVALKKYRPYSVVGRAFDLDHATVIHHCKNHEGNMLSWDGYEEKYKVAEAMCDRSIRYKTFQAKLKSIRAEINRLQEMEQAMIDKVESVQKNSETHE